MKNLLEEGFKKNNIKALAIGDDHYQVFNVDGHVFREEDIGCYVKGYNDNFIMEFYVQKSFTDDVKELKKRKFLMLETYGQEMDKDLVKKVSPFGESPITLCFDLSTRQAFLLHGGVIEITQDDLEIFPKTKVGDKITSLSMEYVFTLTQGQFDFYMDYINTKRPFCFTTTHNEGFLLGEEGFRSLREESFVIILKTRIGLNMHFKLSIGFERNPEIHGPPYEVDYVIPHDQRSARRIFNDERLWEENSIDFIKGK